MTGTSAQLTSPLRVESIPLESPGASIPSPHHSVDPMLSSDPLMEFAGGLAALDAPTVEDWARRVQDLLYDLGYRTPSSDEVDAINETATISFAYPLKDVNGDHIDDVAFDIYCVEADICDDPLGLENILYQRCGLQHWVEVRSGKDGEPLWKHRLDTPHPVPGVGSIRISCSLEFLMGTFPHDGRQDLLVYRWQALWGPAVVLFHHDVYTLSGGGDGQGHSKVAWTYQANGLAIPDHAETVVLLPLLHVVPTQGVRIPPNGTQDALFLRSIGWFQNDQTRYQPDEWAASIHLPDGKEQWKKPTIVVDPTQNPTHSVGPRTFPTTLRTPGWWYGGMFSNGIWQVCCWDLNGDHITELVYVTVEWDGIDANVTTREFDSFVTVFDGKTGDGLYRIQTINDLKTPLGYVWLEEVGDADGDGASDFAWDFFTLDGTEDRWHISSSLRMYKGQSGAELWRFDSDQVLDAFTMGDANGDGGNDVFVSFIDLARGQDHLANVTDNRMAVLDGRSGKILWETTTVEAAYDLAFMYRNYRGNGLADLDGDDVADFWRDRPEQRDDLTMIHHRTFLSGQDGHELFTIPTAGAYAFPVGAKDLDGDHGNDLVVVQGDILDVWMTAYNGRDASPLWSRRLLEIPMASAAWGIPGLTLHAIELDGNASTLDLSFTLNMYISTRAGTGTPQPYFYNQHRMVQGPTGRLLWAVPSDPADDASLRIGEPTPATKLYLGSGAPAAQLAESGVSLRVAALAGLTLGGTLALGFAGAALWRRK